MDAREFDFSDECPPDPMDALIEQIRAGLKAGIEEQRRIVANEAAVAHIEGEQTGAQSGEGEA